MSAWFCVFASSFEDVFSVYIIGLVIFFMMLIYQYMRYQISVLSNDLIMEVLDEKIYKKISSGISSVILFDKVSFIIMLILIIRLVVIIIGM